MVTYASVVWLLFDNPRMMLIRLFSLPESFTLVVIYG